jgi:serine/threonine protein phosphatase PrpC
MNISIGARTDIGGRDNNEDCLAVLDRERVSMRADAVLVIADGMGGRANGEEASAIAVKVVRETLMDLLNPSTEHRLPPAEEMLATAMRRANSAIYDLAQEFPETDGMGTTCIAALVSEGIFTLAHVGDSRAYLIRDNTIQPITSDHTYVADQVRAGNMSAEAAKTSRFRNVITRAIGISPTVEPDFETISLLDTDTILLCTDGLSNTLDESQILGVVSPNETVQGATNALIECAKAHGVRDNVTVIAVRIASDVVSSRFQRSQSLIDGIKPDAAARISTGEHVENSGQGIVAKDPATSPDHARNRRPLFVDMLSLIFGIAIGIGLVYLFAQMGDLPHWFFHSLSK